MEMERCEVEIIANKKCAIMERTTLLEKGVKTLNLEQFMWTHMK